MRRRAIKGTINTALLLRLPATLRKRIEEEAQLAGLSASEWIRQALDHVLSEGQTTAQASEG